MNPSLLPEWSRRPFAAVAAPAGRRLLILVLLLLVLIAGYVLTHQVPRRNALPAPPAAPVEPQAPRYVTLYFANAEGVGLTSEIRPRPPCADEAACVTDTIRTLIDGPGPGLTPLFPLPAELNGINVRGETAVIDLARDTVNRVPGGGMHEILCLTSLANTLAVNFPHIRQIGILIDGVPTQTLKGHVDLRQPFAADFGLVRTSAQTATPSLEMTINRRER